MDPIFSGDTLSQWYEAFTHWLFWEVLTPAQVVRTTMQVPAIVGAGFVSWWVHDFVHPVLEERVRRGAYTDLYERGLLTLVSLVFPVLWALGLWFSIAVSTQFGWSHDVVWIASNLVVAWIIIRLASILVQDPVWSKMIMVVAFTIAGLNIVGLLDPTLAFLDSLAINIGEVRLSVLLLLHGMLSLGILLWVAMLASGVLERRISELPNLTPSVQVLIGKLFKATLILLAVVVALTSIGVDLTALAVFGGAVGVGVGFGLQKVVANLIGGIIILMDKSIKPGDIIRIGDTFGWVSSLGARYVSVETRDSSEYLIPNEDIVTHQVVNWSHNNALARLKVQIQVAHDSDVRRALSLMVDAAAVPARVLDHPEPRALVVGFVNGLIELELRFWINDVQNGTHNISSEVMIEIWELFRTHHIQVPVPQRHVYMDSVPPRRPLSEDAPDDLLVRARALPGSPTG